jgi:hypothetical protein
MTDGGVEEGAVEGVVLDMGVVLAEGVGFGATSGLGGVVAADVAAAAA